MSARDRILTAAAEVMRDQGLARATTKEIARVAGCSEALLYKHFGDKQEIFLGVLLERLPALETPAALVGVRSVRANLVRLTTALLRFYVVSFPIAASVFSSPELLSSWREGMRQKGAGPRGPADRVRGYLAAEVDAGRLAVDLDVDAAASLLCGAALQNAFLAAFDGQSTVPRAEALAARLVDGLALAELSDGAAEPASRTRASAGGRRARTARP